MVFEKCFSDSWGKTVPAFRFIFFVILSLRSGKKGCRCNRVLKNETSAFYAG